MKLFLRIILFAGLIYSTIVKGQFSVNAIVKHAQDDYYYSGNKGSIQPIVTGSSSFYNYTWWSPLDVFTAQVDNLDPLQTYTLSIEDDNYNMVTSLYNIGFKTNWIKHHGTQFRNDSLMPDGNCCVEYRSAITKNTLPAYTDGWCEFVVQEPYSPYFIGFLDSLSFEGALNYEDIDFGYFVDEYNNFYFVSGGYFTLMRTYMPAGTVLGFERVGGTYNLKESQGIVYQDYAPEDKKLKIKALLTYAPIENIGVSFIDTSSIDKLTHIDAFVNHIDPDGSDIYGEIYAEPYGQPPYWYNWTPGNFPEQNQSNCTTGSYTVLVSDANGDNLTRSYSVGYKTKWTDFFKCSFRNDSILGSPSPTQWSTAISKNTLPPSTDGWCELIVKSRIGSNAIGFFDSASVMKGIYSDIDFGFYKSNENLLKIYNGNSVNVGTCYEGDVLRIERIGSSAYLKRNGTVLATNTIVTTKPLKLKLAIFDAQSLANIGCSFTDTTNIVFPNYVQNSFTINNTSGQNVNDGSIMITPLTDPATSYSIAPGAIQSATVQNLGFGTYSLTSKDLLGNSSISKFSISYKVSWKNVNGFTIIDDTLTSGATCATAVSRDSLLMGKNGYVEFTCNNSSNGAIGFIDAPCVASSYSDIDYGVGRFDNTIYKIVGGSFTSIGYGFDGDILRLERVGSTMEFKLNGCTVYTVSATVSNNWKIKAAFPAGNKISNVGASFYSRPFGLAISSEHADYENPFNGSANVEAYGGKSPYYPVWNDGDVSFQKNNLLPGTYTLIVSDSTKKNKVGKIIHIGIKPSWKTKNNVLYGSDSIVVNNSDSLGVLVGNNSIQKNDSGWVELKINKVNQDISFGLLGLTSTELDTTFTPPQIRDTSIQAKTNLAYGLMRLAVQDSLPYSRFGTLAIPGEYQQVHLVRILNGQIKLLFRASPPSSYSYKVGDILKIGRDPSGNMFLARNDSTLYTQAGNRSSQYLYPAIFANSTAQVNSIGIYSKANPINAASTSICNNDLLLNWEATREYDEYGNLVSESKQYFDNLGRPTQTQKKLISENNILVSEAMYDSYGRSAGQTLPAPAYSSGTCFQSSFFTNGSNTHYALSDYDATTTLNNPVPVGNSFQGSLGWYYSDNNTADDYVDADAFPYSRWEYGTLNRVKRKAGVGLKHKMGSGKEDLFSYGGANLSGLFLNNTYELDESFQSIKYPNGSGLNNITAPINITGVHIESTTNPDGQTQKIYTNESGQVIAIYKSAYDEFCATPGLWTLYYYDVKGRLKAIQSPNDLVCQKSASKSMRFDTSGYAFTCDKSQNLINSELRTVGADSTRSISMEFAPVFNNLDSLFARTSIADFKFATNFSLTPRDSMLNYPPAVWPDTVVFNVLDSVPLLAIQDSLIKYNLEHYTDSLPLVLTSKTINYSGKYIYGLTDAMRSTHFSIDSIPFNFEIRLDGDTAYIANKFVSALKIDLPNDSLLEVTNIVLRCADVKIQLNGFIDSPLAPFNPCDSSLYIDSISALLVSNINANIGLICKTIVTGVPIGVAPMFSRKYYYNEYDHLVGYETDDEGRTDYLYDLKEDKLCFSQNEQQKLSNKFSYVTYDALGRTKESGEFDPAITDLSAPTNYKFQRYEDWKNSVAVGSGFTSLGTLASNNTSIPFTNRQTEQSYVEYDMPDATMPLTTSGYSQKYTFGKVRKTYNDNSATWYGYDEMGRVSFMIQNITGLGAKSIDFSYDMRGKLLKTTYQKNTSGEVFSHYNFYDQDERLSIVGAGKNTNFLGSGTFIPATYNYYTHGPLKRTVLGGNLQGLDYVYTINGWLKSVNSPAGNSWDPGADGYTGPHSAVYQDKFAYALDYYPSDYTRGGNALIISTPFNSGYFSGNSNVSYAGKIRAMRWNTATPSGATPIGISGPYMYEYNYDDQYRLKDAIFGSFGFVWPGINPTSVQFNATPSFKISDITYDRVGNIQTLKRYSKSSTSPIIMDDLNYAYASSNANRLLQVTDANTASLGLTADIDIPNQTSSSNYQYNAIGQVTLNIQDNQKYTYNPQGLVTRISNASNIPLADFIYNDKGLRQCKISYSPIGLETQRLYYVYDASGSLVTTYFKTPSTSTVVQDYALYGAGRVGIYDAVGGKPYYEMTDHLGNVRAVVSQGTGTVNVDSYTNYYPHGGIIPGWSYQNTPNYRYNFQGQEKDNESGLVNFELRQMDVRTGRWLNPDPRGQYHSPYLAMGNDPVNLIDPDGGSDMPNPYMTKAFGENEYGMFSEFGNQQQQQTNYGIPQGGDSEGWDASKAEWIPVAEWWRKYDDGDRFVGYKYERKEEVDRFMNQDLMRTFGHQISQDLLESSLTNTGTPTQSNTEAKLGLSLSGADFGAGFYNAIYNHKTYTSTKGTELPFKMSNGKYRETAQALKFLKYSRFVTRLATKASVLSTAYSGYKVFSGKGTALDKVDFGVGLTGLAAPFIFSNPVGWGVGIGASVWGGARLLGDLIGDYDPKGPGVGQFYDPGTGKFMIK